MLSLVKKLRGGDIAATRLFYQQFSPKIVAYLRKKLSPEDSQEILNDVFFEAIDSVSLLKEEEKLLPWLYTIAHNKVVDFYRKRKLVSFLLSQLPLLEIVAHEIDEPEFQYEKDKLRDKIEQTLHTLSIKQQQVLRLHYQEDIPVKQLALRFNLSFKATESLLFRARRSFRKNYERT